MFVIVIFHWKQSLVIWQVNFLLLWLNLSLVSTLTLKDVHVYLTFQYFYLYFTVTQLFTLLAPCSLSFSGSGWRSGWSLKMNNIWTISHYLFRENLMFVYIDMVIVVLDLKCIRLKYMMETINYNKVDPVI